MNFTRQYRLFNPEKNNTNIIIFGAGSTGSFIALNLAKMGIKDITVVDYDKVELHNLPNQFYRIKDVDKYKVEALKETILDFTNVEINAINQKVDESFEIPLDMNTIIINCFDNVEGRKVILNKIKDMPVRVIDTRMGGEGFSIHTVDMCLDEQVKEYEKGLEEEIKETSCGEKAIIYTVLSIASETCNIVKKMANQEPFAKLVRRELKTYRFISHE